MFCCFVILTPKVNFLMLIQFVKPATSQVGGGVVGAGEAGGDDGVGLLGELHHKAQVSMEKNAYRKSHRKVHKGHRATLSRLIQGLIIIPYFHPRKAAPSCVSDPYPRAKVCTYSTKQMFEHFFYFTKILEISKL